MRKRKLLKAIELIFCTLFIVIFFFAFFVNYSFGNISFEQTLFHVLNSEGSDYTILYKGLFFGGLLLILFFMFVYIKNEIYLILNLKGTLKLEINGKEKEFNIFKKTFFKTFLFLSIVGYILLSKAYNYLNFGDYLESQKTASSLFEDYYVDSRDVKLEFPENKRNLIFIYLESMENTNLSKKSGGAYDKSLIPNLEKIAQENINFSHTNKIGGAYELKNTSWTMAALVSTTSGIPFKVLHGNYYKNYGESLPGVYNLGDILSDNGYSNYFMIGSDADFGGRKDYYKYHGDYKILDYNYAKNYNLIPYDYKVFWGYEDLKLFEFAQDKLLKLSKKNEPFNFTMLTVDTHFVDGYMDDSCKNIYDEKYANAIYCSDSKIYNFIEWIKKQDFYDNTTIILVGDHLTMQKGFYNDIGDYKRTMYNAFINSPIEPLNSKNREFSSFDIFPTTLASLGVKIEDNKLGLGVNLFSDEETLLEELGEEEFNSEISKKSFYYDNNILGETYYKMNGLE